MPDFPQAMTPNPHPLRCARNGLGWIVAISLAILPLQLRAATSAPDLDGDGIPNIVDPDVDGDGIPNALDDNVDGGIAKSGPYKGQYLGDHVNNDNPAENDIDSDNLADDSLGETDIDGDSKTDNDPLEMDEDGDRRLDSSPDELDIDGDGRMDDANNEDDIDGDSLDDDDIVEADIDGDNSTDTLDGDIDGDSRSNNAVDEEDVDGDGRLNGDDDDNDGDGYKNRDDDDDNNDGLKDEDDDDHDNEVDEERLRDDLTLTTAALSNSEASVSIQRMATGTITLKIEAGDCNPATYEIVIGGITRGTLVTAGKAGKASGERKFRTGGSGEYLPINFDVIGQPISIKYNGVDYYTGIIPTPPDAPPGGDGEPPTTSSKKIKLMTGSGVSSEAEAEVTVDFGLAGVIELEIEAEKIPAGTYDISIDGTLRGTLVIEVDGSDLKGSRHFEVIPDEPGELLLDFPVVGKSIAITQSGTTWFSGTIPTAG